MRNVGRHLSRTCEIDGIDGVDKFYQGTQSSSGRPLRPPPTETPKTQTTSAKTTKKQPLRPRWSTFWDIDELQVPSVLKQRLPHTLQSLRRPRTPAGRYVCSAARSMSMEARR